MTGDQRAGRHDVPTPDDDSSWVPDRESESSAAGESGDPGRRSAAEAVERELVLMFRRARTLSASVAAQVHPDLDAASYGVLLMVDDAGSMRGMDLAEKVGLDKSTVSRQIAHLVALDLLERAPDPDDGRARRIQLTELGRTRLREVRCQRRQHLYDRFGSWSTDDLRELARLLGKLNDEFM